MSLSYVGEVRLVGFDFAPDGWALCAGQTIPIQEYNTLFSLIGTTYGGDGQTNFNLPDLRGRIPIHQGTGGGNTYSIGQTGGLESVSLNLSQYPTHNHVLLGSTNSGAGNNPAGDAVGAALKVYSTDAPATAMNSKMLGFNSGGSQPHENRQPYLVLNWIISLYGTFPSQS